MASTESWVKQNSKNLYTFINTISVSSTVYLGDRIRKDYQKIVNLFVQKFGSVYKDFDLSSTQIFFDYINTFGQMMLKHV